MWLGSSYSVRNDFTNGPARSCACGPVRFSFKPLQPADLMPGTGSGFFVGTARAWRRGDPTDSWKRWSGARSISGRFPPTVRPATPAVKWACSGGRRAPPSFRPRPLPLRIDLRYLGDASPFLLTPLPASHRTPLSHPLPRGWLSSLSEGCSRYKDRRGIRGIQARSASEGCAALT
jgi:hypothetical protein